MSENKNKFRVDFTGILDILSKHLYSGEDVFIRELLQNAKDAITARKINETSDYKGQVSVEIINHENNAVLIFEDNGIGLTISEVESFLSVIGSSSKKKMNDMEDIPTSFVGQFGIGLLSCFLVSDKITLISKSDKSDKAVKWEATIDGLYESSELETTSLVTGTKIFLELNEDKRDIYNKQKLRQLLKKYSQFLNIEVKLIEKESSEDIIRNQFPWEHHVSDDKEVVQFGRKYFDINFHYFINLESHGGMTQGLGYIYPFPSKPGGKSANHVYIKNMLIDEEAGDLLPEWAFFIKAVVNSDILKPTASRESLYKNNTLTETAHQFEKCIHAYFKKLTTDAPYILEEIVNTHNLAIKAFATSDNSFFDLIIDYISFPTSRGNMKAKEFLTFDNVKYVENIDSFRQVLPIAKANDQLVINGGYIYDSSLLNKLESKHRSKLSKLDDLRFDSILKNIDWEEENTYTEFKEKCNAVLREFKCECSFKKFAPISLPAIFHLDADQKFSRDVERTKQITNDLWGGVLDEMVSQNTYTSNSILYMNMDNVLILKISKIMDPTVFKTSVELIYINALMAGHYALNAKESNLLNKNLLSLIDLVN